MQLWIVLVTKMQDSCIVPASFSIFAEHKKYIFSVYNLFIYYINVKSIRYLYVLCVTTISFLQKY